MKHFFIPLALTATVSVFFACSKEQDYRHSVNERTVKVTACREQPLPSAEVKSTLSDEGDFAWSAGDAFKVFVGGSSWTTSSSLASAVPSGESAGFTVTLVGDQQMQKAAVIPSFVTPSLEGNALTLSIPSQIPWVEGEADNLMLAAFDSIDPTSLSFKNVGGTIKITLNNIPVGASKVIFTAGKNISGDFTIADITAANPQISATDGSAGITFTFDALAAPADMCRTLPMRASGLFRPLSPIR